MLKVRPRPERTLSHEERRVHQTRRRFLRRQRARRWLVWRRLLGAAAVVGAAGALVWVVFFSSVLAVEGAVVEGLEVLTAEQVTEVAAVPVGVPLATADLDAVRARVETLAPVRSAEVSRNWPDQVRIVVEERTAVAVVQSEGTWRALDAEGVLFRDLPSPPEGLPQVRIRATTPVEALAEGAAVVQALPDDMLARVEFLDVRTVDAISLTLTGGAVVNWGSADQSARKVQVLRVLLEQEARTYDVTAPGRPTVRS